MEKGQILVSTEGIYFSVLLSSCVFKKLSYSSLTQATGKIRECNELVQNLRFAWGLFQESRIGEERVIMLIIMEITTSIFKDIFQLLFKNISTFLWYDLQHRNSGTS